MIFYFLLCSSPVEGGFGDDFSGEDFFGFHIRNLIALGKTTSTEGFTSGILFDNNLSIGLGDFFLNDHCICPIRLLGICLGFHLYI